MKYIAFITLVVSVLLLFQTVPTSGAFWWSEAPRNALSGAFIRDLLLEWPIADPVEWAEAYYRQYPALVILFYPPMFHGILAIFFLFLGVSHWAAMVAVFAMYTLLVFGVYRLGYRFFGSLGAAGAALAFCMSPEVSLWGRQVMLEVPMMAFAVWSVWFGLRYIDKSQPFDLYSMAFLGICALYTKQTSIFLIILMGVLYIVFLGKQLFIRCHFWIIMTVSIISLLPLLYIQIKYESFNVVNVANHPQGVSGASVLGLIWYLVRFPETVGWLILLPAIAFIVWRLPNLWYRSVRPDTVLLVLWFVAGYIFFTVISLKETRHALLINLPISFAATGLFYAILNTKIRDYGCLVFGIVVSLNTLIFHPVPYVKGYNAAADFVSKNAPPNATILFAGLKDGDFIFNVRAHEERRDLTILRADKLFLDIAVLTTLGVGAKDFSSQQIADMLIRYGIYYVVSDGVSYRNIPVIERFFDILHSDMFEPVETIPIVSNVGQSVRQLKIFHNIAKLPDKPEQPSLHLKVINRTIN
jgi:4-amino-4-deoxy-L-arabinose transferase-like glycosyltransferase